jgi:hypothetical protein
MFLSSGPSSPRRIFQQNNFENLRAGIIISDEDKRNSSLDLIEYQRNI